MNDNRNRPVITGMGAVTPVGLTVSETWESLCSGTSGIRKITLFDTSGLRNSRGGEIRGFTEDAERPRSLQFLEKATGEALSNGNILENSEILEETGFALGTNFGCAESFSRYYTHRDKNPSVSTDALHQYPFGYYADTMRDEFGIKGECVAVSTACASGLAAVEAALQILKYTDAESVICAATDELTLYSYAGLCALHAVTKETIRPFAESRAGTQFSEGAAVVLIEYEDHARSRGISPLARIEGIFLNNDAFHTTAPDTEAAGITNCMEQVFKRSNVPKENVTYVNSHGTGTKYNDVIETRALKNVFGPHAHNLYIDSIKSMTGHEMGAAGLIELISTVMTLQTGTIPPTVNCSDPDPECDLNYCTDGSITADIECALTNSYGIGGANGSVLLSAFRE